MLSYPFYVSICIILFFSIFSILSRSNRLMLFVIVRVEQSPQFPPKKKVLPKKQYGDYGRGW